MSLGFHQAYCKPCQKRRAWRMRRISWRRATMPSSRYCRTSSRRACTSFGFRSSRRSLLGPRSVVPSRGAACCAPTIEVPNRVVPFSSAGATALAAFPSAGAIAPGVPVQVSAVGYRSIRPRPFPAVKIYVGVAHGIGFTPRLNLVPRTLTQARQRLWFRRLRVIHRRKSRGAQQRVGERAILRAQTGHFAFQHSDVPPAEQAFDKIPHFILFGGQTVARMSDTLVYNRSEDIFMARVNRQKISTTIAPENAAFLKSLLKRGKDRKSV